MVRDVTLGSGPDALCNFGSGPNALCSCLGSGPDALGLDPMHYVVLGPWSCAEFCIW